MARVSNVVPVLTGKSDIGVVYSRIDKIADLAQINLSINAVCPRGILEEDGLTLLP